MRTTTAWATVSLALFLAGLTAAAEAPKDPDFAKHIAPIFRKYCSACHNAKEAEGGLVLDDYAKLLQGGKRGAALVPKSAERSRMILMLTGKSKPSMPPEGNDPPKAEEIALLRAWIDAGAKGPAGAAADPTVLVTPQVKLLAPPRATIFAAAWSGDGKLIALAGYGAVRLIAADSREVVRELPGHRGNVNAVSFSKDSQRLLAASGEPGLFGEVRVWNVADGKLLQTFTGHGDSLYAAVLSPDGKTLATSSYDEKVKLWDAASGKERATLEGHNGAVYDLAFTQDSRLLASASGDRTVKLWDVASARRMDTFGESLKEVYTVAFSPDGRQVAAAGVDNRIRVWRLSDSAREGTNQIVHSRFGHQGPIIKLVWSPDGRALASSDEDRTLKLWDSATLAERHLLPQQSDWTPALAFSPDGKRLLAGRLDGTYAIYDAASGKVVPPPKPELTGPPTPRGVQQGVPTKIKLAGKHLREVQRATFSDGRIVAKVLPDESAGGQDKPEQTWLEVTAPTGVPRGAYDVAVVTEGGTSGIVKLYVDDVQQVAEVEPNDALDRANLASLPASLWGVIDRKGDTDHFAFEAKAGQTIVLDLAGAALGAKLNAVLTVLDSQGRVLADSNDFDEAADPLVAFQVPADGRYVVRVSDLALGASGEHFYRLSAGVFPYVTGIFPLSIPANQETEVTLAGFNLPPDARVKVKAGGGGEAAIPLDAKRFRFRQGFSALVSQAPDVLENEPNNLPRQATPISAPGAASGRIAAAAVDAPPDVDLYRFAAKAGETWVVETQAAQRGSPIDTKIEVLDAQGQPVPRVLLQATRDSYITFRGIDSRTADCRVVNWEEMELNELLYLNGELVKLFRMPQGPDSGFLFYSINGQRRCYFDTSPSVHAVEEPCYIVRPHPIGAKLVPNGLPVFTLYYANDDDGERRLGRDSKLMFTAPADGDYLVRVGDVRGQGGDRYAYRLLLRRPQPGFAVSLGGDNPVVAAGSGKELTFNADRFDGFEDEIQIEVAGLPPGFSISKQIAIEAGHRAASAVLYAAADAPQPTKENWEGAKITAKATINGQVVSKEVGGLGRIGLAAKPQVLVRIEPAELTIQPGTTIMATLRIERNGFNEAIRFDVNNLPHGVIVDNIGLNGVLIPAGQTQRQLFINARAWVPDNARPFHAVAPVAGTQVSPPVLLRVKR
jgi:WD40 repeat protein